MAINTKFKVLALVAGLSASLSALASTAVTFDPTGTPGASGDIRIGALDQSPGNALAIGASAGSRVGTSFNLLYQANLGTANDTNGNAIYLNGTAAGNKFFTFTAGFNEVVTGNTINPATGVGTLTFGFGPSNTSTISSSNFFYMYAMTASGSNLAGTGFAGTAPILTGHFVSTGYVSAFTANGLGTTPVPLDSFGANSYPNVTTIVGAGSTVATLVIDSFNTAYFPDLVVGATSSLINTSQNLAFNQVDPSALFSTNGTSTGGTTAGVGSVGSVNGISGPNTIFQADANQSFQTTAVPEPTPAALMGLGLVAFALSRRKGAKKQ